MCNSPYWKSSHSLTLCDGAREGGSRGSTRLRVTGASTPRARHVWRAGPASRQGTRCVGGSGSDVDPAARPRVGSGLGEEVATRAATTATPPATAKARPMPDMNVSWMTLVMAARTSGVIPGACASSSGTTPNSAACSSRGSGGTRDARRLPVAAELGVDLGGHHGAQDGGAQRAADLHGRLLQAARHAGELQRRVADDDLGGAHHHRGEPQAQQGEPQRRRQRAGLRREGEHAEHGRGGAHHAADQGDTGPEPGDQGAASGEDTIIMAVSGGSRRPLSTGLRPLTPWR